MKVKIRRALSVGARTVRYSRAWPWVRPVYAPVRRFFDLRPLVHDAGGDGVEDQRSSFIRVRGEPPDCAVLPRRMEAGNAERPEFALYRIVGNDLWPRHRKGQSRQNVAWILEHEPELPGCEKRWVVNRIFDPGEERSILEMLDEAGAPYIHIPFEWEAYRRVGWDLKGVPAEWLPWSRSFAKAPDDVQARALMRLYRLKNNYAMNNNGARNVALEDGRGRADWVLPWDGNCFVARGAWDEIVEGVNARSERPYHIVPMARITDNRQVLEEDARPEAQEEPQIVFRRDAAECFDEAFCYGRRPKVELLWRLGVSGPWDRWRREPWDLDFPEYSAEAGCFSWCGWVARLYSGRADQEVSRGDQAFQNRGVARVEAITSTLDELDSRAFEGACDAMRLHVVDEGRLEAATITTAFAQSLRARAEEALKRGPYSVLDKSTLPPSGSPRDYWHPAPYYWPHPLRVPGLPYKQRDGERVPGTRLYEPESERYDRTRLQRLFDDTLVLSLAYWVSGERHFGEHAVRLVRRWFLDEQATMTPHLEYAQVRRGHNGNRGVSSGIIEFKDLYFFLDGVRLLVRGGLLSERERVGLEEWLGQYLHWLRTSSQGVGERGSRNNHGTYYDLQVASIAAFLGDWKQVRHTLRDSRSRILTQFSPDGRMPRELDRTLTAHYECFTVQGWIHLARLAEAAGEDLWSFEGPEGQGLRRGMEWLLGHFGKVWPYQQIEPFDTDRFYPILFAYREKYGELPAVGAACPEPEEVKPVFFPHDGIPPFWQLGLRPVGAP